MSTICALKAGESIWLASDSLANDGEAVVSRVERKWVLCGGTALALAGSCYSANLIERHADRLVGDAPAPGLLTDRLIEVFAGRILPRDEQRYTKDYGCELIYTAAGQVWHIDCQMAYTTTADFCAAGSGAAYAYGAEYMGRLLGRPPRERIKEALLAAMHYDLYSGGEVYLYELHR